MDQQILEFITGALAAGATAMWKGFFTEAGKNAYNELKSLLSGDPDIKENIERLEKQPNRASYQLSIKEDVERLALHTNPNVLDAAEAVIEAAQPHSNEISSAAAVDINNLKAEFVKIKRVRTSGLAAVKLQGGDLTGGLTITDVDAGSTSANSKKN